MTEYDMDYILILGSTSDIGNALAEKYLNKGYGLILAGRNEESLKTQKDTLLNLNASSTINIAPFNASNFESHAAFYNDLPVKPMGVITVIGYLGEQKVSELSFKETHEVYAANLIGNVSILNIIATNFEKRSSGFIVGVSSVAGLRGRKSNYIYGSAKAGFISYLSGLRNRLHGSNISVLTVLPGFVATKMTQHLTLPKRLTATPNEVANAIYKAQQRQKSTVFVKPIWRYIMIIIQCIPEFIFKRLSL